jgi:hypothetical protein
MPYQVIKPFRDLKDDSQNYRKGDTYPVKGKVDQERLEELSGSDNAAGYPLIKKVDTDPEPQGNPKGDSDESEESEESEFPKHTGGAWYELSNGEKIQGKDEAIAAEAELK